jgi:Tol biopolymer transport system component
MRSSFFLASLALILALPAAAQTSKIVYCSAPGNVGDIWVMNPDGTGAVNLTNTPGIDEGIPAWSQDGTKIVYQREGDIWWMNADGTNQHRLNVNGGAVEADFRPGTDLISYSRYGGSSFDIFTIHQDGTGETRIINGPVGDYEPRWSPDGTRLSYYADNVYNGVNKQDIYIANADGSGVTQITHAGGDYVARWSPDGTQLVFESDNDGNREIYTMNIDGTNRRRLTNNTYHDTNACWSPDGKKILFGSDRDGDSELYTMNLDGSGVTQLTFNSVEDRNADWKSFVPPSGPTVNISDAAVTEGSSGAAANTANFTISLTSASPTPVTVTYRTSDGTAIAGQDYTAIAPTSITFAPGETSKIVSVPVIGDTLDEIDETFNVSLSVSGANLGDIVGVGTIKDDDAAPGLDIKGATISEGTGGLTTLNVPINLTAVSSLPVSVHYSTADDTAIAGQDYVAASGTVTIPAGSTAGFIPVSIIGDTALENSEGFFINLASPVNASRLLHTQARGTINNDDTVPGLTVSDVTVAEGNTAVFTVTLSKSISKAVTVTFATADGTATAGSDYDVTNGTLTIPAGQTTATISVPTTDDSLPENAETFRVNLSNPANASITAGVGTGTITSDDVAKISISSVSMLEGDSGNRAMYFTVSVSEPSPFPVSVNYATTPSSAKAGSDFIAASGTVTIPANQTSVALPIQIIGDKVYENNELFYVDLSSPSGVTIAQSRGNGSILNDDPAPATTLKVQPADPSGEGS